MLDLPLSTEIFYTADGSPTLCFERGDGYREKMHHSGGALGESIYIYHGALLEVLNAGVIPQILSVGLGLGYNEMLAQAELSARGLGGYRIWSFEALEALREGFRAWILGEDGGELPKVFAQVCAMVSAKIPVVDLRGELRSSLRAGRLELRGRFPEDSQGVSANTVFYDAYSRKMDEGLWDEKMLTQTFEKILLPDCALATYARTGNLNRSLRALGFRPSGKTGFAGKRESTMAFRGTVG